MATSDEQEEWDYRAYRIGWLETLCAMYEQGHDWENDEDPSATREMLREVRAVHAELIGQLGDRPTAAVEEAVSSNIPF